MAKAIASVVGVVFIIVGIVGFFEPHLLHANLGKAHNVIHLVSGAVSLYFGMKGSMSAARQFCIIFGIVYGLLGVVGYLVGSGEEHMLPLTGYLQLGTRDHIIHLVIAILYLLGGFATKTGTPSTAEA
jgi:preprotein translocase subunit Sss1